MLDYSHLNGFDKVDFSISKVAEQVFNQNYGVQRFLVEILKIRESDDKQSYPSYSKNTQKLRELLESDFF
jgi:hypothetical protein